MSALKIFQSKKNSKGVPSKIIITSKNKKQHIIQISLNFVFITEKRLKQKHKIDTQSCCFLIFQNLDTKSLQKIIKLTIHQTHRFPEREKVKNI